LTVNLQEQFEMVKPLVLGEVEC